MAFRKLPTLGDKPADVSNDMERVKSEIARPQTVVEYTVTTGTNVVKHGTRAVPKGRHLVWSTVGTVTDISITSTSWTFSVASAGTIKVIWL